MVGAGVAGVCVLVWLGALSVYDIRDRRLPNWLTLPGAVVILMIAAAAGHAVRALVGGALLFAVYLIVHLIAPAAMGAGDVKLAIGVGALTGSFGNDVWLLAALGAPLVTAMFAIVALVVRARSTVPHGPSMCATAAAAIALVLI
jgi:leader peptidase (prepilin peptidase)/N-methyltransferase